MTAVDRNGTESAGPTPLEAVGLRGFVARNVLEHGGLGRRERTLLAIAADTGVAVGPALEADVHRALSAGVLSLAELREAALHLAAYQGHPRAAELDECVTRVWEALVCEGADVMADRLDAPAATDRPAAEVYAEVVRRPLPDRDGRFHRAVNEFVWGELWNRGVLTFRDRRVLSLVSTALAGHEMPLRIHVAGALDSGDLGAGELEEVAVQFATAVGMPSGQLLARVVEEESAEFRRRTGAI
ncbi:carboxymuconolactone decarboxylase family protein [Streptomyces flaveolus]|uniref:carboxymuconolactone decarboxylase family protein n=1 Tax=Streptomyces flaveolus TaxID=67297 RepID=UPI00382B22F7